MSISKKSAPAQARANALVSPLTSFFTAAQAMKENRHAMRKAACAILLAAENTVSVTLTDVPGMNKANVAKLDRLIAPAAIIELDWDKSQHKLTMHVEDCKFTSAQRDDLKKGKIPQIHEVQREVDLDAISRRIQSMLKGLEASDIEAVLADVTESLKDVEQA